MRAHEIKGASVQRHERTFRQRPAEPCGRQAERGWRRQHHHVLRRDLTRQQRADAVVERIARGEDADGAAAIPQYLLDRALERAGPRARSALNERRRKAEMALAAEHNLGAGNASARDGTEPRDTILADADDRQPAL